MRFSEEVLRLFLRDAVRSGKLHAVAEHGRLTCATYMVACCAVAQVLGPDWSEKHVGRSDKACDYFKADRKDREALLRYMARATEFGDLIYNLHGVAGFEERINSIRTDDKCGAESGIAELIAGKFFKMANVGFQYVVVKKQAGQKTPKNPDIEYVAGLNRVEFCEVKCNLQSTELNERSIINTLKGAKAQLPKGKAGIILLRVPENWLIDMVRAMTVIGDAVTEFIRAERTTRVSSVFVFASETRFLPTEQMAQVFRIKEFRNSHCQMGSGIPAFNLDQAMRHWRTVESLARNELAIAGSTSPASPVYMA